MTAPYTPSLSEQQIVDYHEEGYLIVRDVLSAKEAAELRRIVQQRVQRGAAHPATRTYPESAKYTVSGNMMAEPGTRLDCRTSDSRRGRGVRTRRPRAPDRLRGVSADAGRPGRRGPHRLQALATCRFVHELGVRHYSAERLRRAVRSLSDVTQVAPAAAGDRPAGTHPGPHGPRCPATAAIHRPGAARRRLAGGQRACLAQGAPRYHQRRPLRHFPQVLCRRRAPRGRILSVQSRRARRLERHRQTSPAGLFRPAD